MARTAVIESFEQKIEKAQMDVVKTKQKYDAAVTKLVHVWHSETEDRFCCANTYC
ncbi:hypothetical protein GH810_08470 [Acetobacterium paludosum]|uniref:Uncharacterized protein n=1 Tax=Acetobacterium paludosum TaxID=52693 RepID=A0A923HW98_9FIRM|nr:hypothetical protein [Acetobacterium paludosum]MBC3888342.1 hypothetical protein [Acetobacterium paludosum]